MTCSTVAFGGDGGGNEQRIGQTRRGLELGDTVEDQREDHHGHKRTNHRPRDADDGLVVAHQDVPPREDVEQFPEVPQVLPILLLGPAGFDDQLPGFLVRHVSSVGRGQ